MSDPLPATIRHPMVSFNIARLYSDDMTDLELYEATRGAWVLGERRNTVDYAAAVYDGVIREVYAIEAWHPAGTLDYETRDSSDFEGEERWEFSGHVARDIREQYIGRRVSKGTQNPVRYLEIDG